MRIVVCGGRNFSGRNLMYRALDVLHSKRFITTLIHGGANGADRLANDWAEFRGVNISVYPADWGRHGNAAGPIRNGEMVKEGPDLVVFAPGGRGTNNMIQQAEKEGIETVALESILEPYWNYKEL